MTRGGKVLATRVGLIAGSVALLEAACRLHLINPLTLIPPSEMVVALAGMLADGELTGDIMQTFASIGVAFVTAVAAGFVLGAGLHRLPVVRRAIDPLLASWYAVPVFVFYPLLVAVLGLGNLPLIAIGVLAAVPAMMLSTLVGLDRVPRVLRKAARMHRLGPVATVWLVVLPAALPNLFNGLKLALAYAFIGVIAGEFILSTGGLGHGIAYAYEAFDNDAMYGRMLFVLLAAVVANGVLYTLEVRLNRRRGRA